MGITHFSIHTGKTKKIRAQAAPPSSPTPETGDIWLDTTNGAVSLVIYVVNNWSYTGMEK